MRLKMKHDLITEYKEVDVVNVVTCGVSCFHSCVHLTVCSVSCSDFILASIVFTECCMASVQCISAPQTLQFDLDSVQIFWTICWIRHREASVSLLWRSLTRLVLTLRLVSQRSICLCCIFVFVFLPIYIKFTLGCIYTFCSFTPLVGYYLCFGVNDRKSIWSVQKPYAPVILTGFRCHSRNSIKECWLN